MCAILLLFLSAPCVGFGENFALKQDCNSLVPQGLGGRGFSRQSRERINPVRMTGVIARVMERAEALYGIEFYIDWDTPRISNAENRQIFLSRDFLIRPQLGHLLHEIKHTITYLKLHPTRGIHFEASATEALLKDHLEIYNKAYSFDELEARIVEAAATSDVNFKKVILRDASSFWREETRLIDFTLELLDRVSLNAAVLLFNQQHDLGGQIFKARFERSHFIRVENRGEDFLCLIIQRGSRALYDLCFPVEAKISKLSAEEKISYMKNALSDRKHQLEILKPRLEL